MLRHLFFYLFVCIGWYQAFAMNHTDLQLSHVRETMEKMFSYHLENRAFDSLVARRSLRVYLEQFDPDQFYFIKSEVEPFLCPNDHKVDQMIEDYNQDCFSMYVNLNQVIQKTVVRNRQIRREAIEWILERHSQVLSEPILEKSCDYAQTIQELRERIKSRFLQDIKMTVKSRKIETLSSEIVQKILLFREKKIANSEDLYLLHNNSSDDHYLTLHILKALTKSLDAHSGYYSPQEAYEIRTTLRKEFAGIGVVLREEFDGVYVADLINGSPAHRSQKIAVGDLIVSLNNQSIADKEFDHILDMMKGESGSTLTLELFKKEQCQVESVDLIREKVILHDARVSFAVEQYADGIIGKITIPSFYDNGNEVSIEKDLHEALRNLHIYGKIYGLILDLRENSGGFLTQAIKVSAMFINGGVIVVSKYADGEVNYARDIDGRYYYGGPLIVLISKASASAAEILAGALQDHGVALIAGDDRSYGKGSMQYQTLTDENASSFFKVTVGRYYTASGRSPQITGVKSDIHVPTVFYPYNIGERYLAYPISADQLTGEVFDSLMKKKAAVFRNKRNVVVPYLGPRLSKWRKMLVQLQANSQKRLDKDHNFQCFLQIANAYVPRRSSVQSSRKIISSNFGVVDLQIKEVIEIIKDMCVLK